MDRTGSVELDGVLNFRDVGKTVNQFLGERRLREGLIYRSALPDHATARDKETITTELGIKTVIDLRTKTEHLEQVAKLQTEARDSSAGTQTFRIPGLEYHDIRITGRAFERHVVRQLSWWNFFKVLFFFLLGYRVQAIQVMAQEVMLPRGLVRLGLDTLDHSGVEIHQALSLYTNARSLPSVVHCTQGKDRTGLICALVLMILGMPTSAIEHDYSLTDAGLASDRESRVAQIRSVGLSEEWADTDKTMIAQTEEHLKSVYGGLDQYLDHIGFGHGEREKVRYTLLY